LVFQGSFSCGSTNLGLWFLVATTKTMLIMALCFFSILHGRLCFRTSHVPFIYGDNHKSCVLENYKWNNDRSKTSLISVPLFSMVSTCSFPCLRINFIQQNFFLSFNLLFELFRFQWHTPLDASVYEKNCTSF
jgi:hypothetical protein